MPAINEVVKRPQPRELTPFVSVSSQLFIQDIRAARERGFKAVINSRPDHEEQLQSTSASLREAAEWEGLEYRYIPVVPGNVSRKDVAESKHFGADTLIATVKSDGYDIAALKPALLKGNEGKGRFRQ